MKGCHVQQCPYLRSGIHERGGLVSLKYTGVNEKTPKPYKQWGFNTRVKPNFSQAKVLLEMIASTF